MLFFCGNSRNFNPRPREEGDVKLSNCRSKIEPISIHALVKRATFYNYCISENYIISIHALVKRATFTAQSIIPRPKHFNPRPREEGDAPSVHKKGVNNDFNPRPREEGDLAIVFIFMQQKYFNPRPREEGDLTV